MGRASKICLSVVTKRIQTVIQPLPSGSHLTRSMLIMHTALQLFTSLP